jgi:putative endonuclease
MAFYVYILASQRNGTLYTGYTDDLFRRMTEHRAHTLSRFTAKYGVTLLVFHEAHETRESAWTRERRIKKLATGVEDRADRALQPRLARPL